MKQQAMKSFKLSVAIMIAAVMLLLAACGSGGESGSGASTNGAPANGASQSAASEEPSTGAATGNSADAKTTAYPLTVKDASGTEITFDKAPERVVSLVPSETETLFAIGAGDEVVGVDEYSNYPEEASKKTKIGDLKTNVEAVTALNPDLVVASSTMNAEAIEKLRQLNIKVYASAPKTYDETVDKIGQLGLIMNKQEQSGQVQQHMKDVKQQVTDAVKDAPKTKVYLEFSPGWTVGKGEFMDELVTLAGGTNVAGDQSGWFEVNSEQIVKANPELIVYPKLDGNPILPGIKSRAGWSVIDAVKNNRFAEVPMDPLVRVGPRLADGLLDLAKAIHPDLVK
ncbi:ABC transporter substrate-binding protein [Paenibacillus beijingensis]|uniref:ABC transporter substrate-binding protein n=1 Tax=Paenibacillus beijingensis TaxID=1126833 RepID=A0A0D5NNE0_9BACL|nr:ABC transporter substrate-binding protein [Paenibacillus beijingensis]AJY76655.1 ABC transporter substrate-binding protein [Paenibacillus beijingensis]